ncbi:MAG: hypothetical protein KC457_03710, partial [Myxococcales bacterium]|nr:hypothetical protein [Myxococcales bacterium]
SMSGAPGGPLGLLLVEYDDIPDEDAALLAHVKTLYGHDPHFEAGPATMVEIGGQRWRAATCRTGAELTHATNLVVLWSKSLEQVRSGTRGDDGYVLTLTLSGELEAQALLDHPILSVVVDSLP